MFGWKWRIQLDGVTEPVPHDLVRRIRSWRIQSLKQVFKFLYWTISKIFSEIYLPVKKHKSLIGSIGSTPTHEYKKWTIFRQEHRILWWDSYAWHDSVVRFYIIRVTWRDDLRDSYSERLVGSLKLLVSFSKEPYKTDYILQKTPTVSKAFWKGYLVLLYVWHDSFTWLYHINYIVRDSYT